MKIAVLTSGGDSPGMNACIRSVVRTAVSKSIDVFGVFEGYEGLIDADFKRLDTADVANILQRGGTILKSARSKRFLEKKWRDKAVQSLKNESIDALVLIGGDGTFRGGKVFSSETDIQVVGVPGTIDNDMFGTDYTIGYDSAINTVVEAIDKIRDTAASHNRLFIVEVMGRDSGFIALESGIATGAEAILIPEIPTLIDQLIAKLESGRRSNKTSGIIIVAEGDDFGGAYDVQKVLNERFGHYETRVSILGHMQRGGNPTAKDRLLASRLGSGAVEAILEGRSNTMVGQINNRIELINFDDAVKGRKTIDHDVLKLSETLSI